MTVAISLAYGVEAVQSMHEALSNAQRYLHHKDVLIRQQCAATVLHYASLDQQQADHVILSNVIERCSN